MPGTDRRRNKTPTRVPCHISAHKVVYNTQLERDRKKKVNKPHGSERAEEGEPMTREEKDQSESGRKGKGQRRKNKVRDRRKKNKVGETQRRGRIKEMREMVVVCNGPPIASVVMSDVSKNSSVPLRLPSPARMMYCPAGDQNRAFTAFFSSVSNDIRA